MPIEYNLIEQLVNLEGNIKWGDKEEIKTNVSRLSVDEQISLQQAITILNTFLIDGKL